MNKEWPQKAQKPEMSPELSLLRPLRFLRFFVAIAGIPNRVGCNAAKRHCIDPPSARDLAEQRGRLGAIALRTIAPYVRAP